MVRKLLFAVLLFISTFGFSQNMDNKLFDRIKCSIENSDYIGARMLLDKAETAGTLNAHQAYLKGLCNFYLPNQKNNATLYFARATCNTNKNYKFNNNETAAPLKSWLYLAKCYNSALLLDSAIYCYTKYAELIGQNDKFYAEVSRYIEMCKNAKKYIPVNSGEFYQQINTEENALNSGIVRYVSPDKQSMVFTTITNTELHLFDNVDIFNIFISNYDPQTKKWLAPEKITVNESEVTGIAPESQTIFISKKSKKGDMDIYFTSNKDGKWSELKKLDSPINESKSNETNACMSTDGSTLYFVSDREGGIGGKDIYKSMRKTDGTWGTPQNLGRTINTPYDEESPYLLSDAVTLYFSSKGHDSMGGFDIFNTTLNEDGFWSKVDNMGYPINTVEDDVFFFLTKDETNAFYSSAKKGSSCGPYIFQIKLH